MAPVTPPIGFFPKLRAYLAISLLVPFFYFALGKNELMTYWPFINYPMFSHILKNEKFRFLRIYSVNFKGKVEPFLLTSYLTPFTLREMRSVLYTLRLKDPSKELSKIFLNEILKKYQRQVSIGRELKDDIKALQIYEVLASEENDQKILYVEAP